MTGRTFLPFGIPARRLPCRGGPDLWREIDPLIGNLCVEMKQDFLIKIAPSHGILGNNLVGMSECLSLKYYADRCQCVAGDN